MRRVIAWLVGLAVLLGIVLLPAAIFGSGDGTTEGDPARITDYRAEFVVDENGRLDVVETLRVGFPVSRHGIFRFFDLHDPGDSRARL